MSSSFDRQIILPGFGKKGQQALADVKILIVGLGGLGCPTSLYLTTSGVGEISLLDGDVVSESNLHRQILFNKTDIGEKKVNVAERVLTKHATSETKFNFIDRFFSIEYEYLIKEHDITIDCTDNLKTKFLLNDLCVLYNKKYIYASIYQYSAQVSLFSFPETGCLRCIFPEITEGVLSPSCKESGVLPSVVGMVGNIQALEAIKSTVYPDKVNSIFNIYDFFVNTHQTLDYNKNENCRVCSKNISLDDVKRLNASSDGKFIEMSYLKLSDYTDAILVDVRTLSERKAFNIGGEHIPLDILETNLDKLPIDRKIVLYCEKGIRSKIAANILVNHGFKKVFTLKDGISSCHG